jgi:hypothetical protein
MGRAAADCQIQSGSPLATVSKFSDIISQLRFTKKRQRQPDFLQKSRKNALNFKAVIH